MATGEIVKPREIVKADNDFFRVRCKVKNIIASRIVMAFASLVDESNLNEKMEFLEYKIEASSIIGDIEAGGDYYNQLREAAYILLDQKLEKRKHKNHFKVWTLFSSIEYENGIITGKFHSDLLPFFIGLKEQFTKLSLSQYLKLPSIYSQQLFGFLQSWNDKPEVVISLLELHDMLNTPESFRKDFRQLRLYVLEKSYKDIISKTNLYYEWEPIKKGRAVVSIRFIFSKKRALPVSKVKETEKQEKKSKQNNKDFLAALACRKERGPACEGGRQKESVCELCKRISG